ncbi:MAG: hypothetical protein M1818_006823 [Claussenomyces sp. TS43310]|nr:MAG: hypothetical protein M1818_006823 [Claussenomyces sp. TS43310]
MPGPALLDPTILWWDTKTLAYLCPYCRNVEHLPVQTGNPLRPGRSKVESLRLTRCQEGFVSIRLPDSSSYLACEIDRESMRYKTVGQTCGYENNEEIEEESDNNGTPKHDTAARISRADLSLLRLVNDKVQISPNCCNISQHVDLRQDSIDKIVTLLLDGTDPNLKNARGQTLLMQAVASSRTEAVALLLSQNADKSIKNNNGLRAAEMVANSYSVEQGHINESKCMEKERQSRTMQTMLGAACRCHVYAPFGSKNLALLHFERQGRPSQARNTSRMRQPPFAAIAVTNAGTRNFAVLDRGPEFERIIAVSGATGKARGPSSLLNNKIWSEHVWQYGKLLQHGFPDYNLDAANKGAGRWFASHAEKQLGAFVLHKHFILKSEAEQCEALRRLRAVRPAQIFKTVTLQLSREACPDCLSYLDKVGRACGVEFRYERMGTTEIANSTVLKEPTPAPALPNSPPVTPIQGRGRTRTHMRSTPTPLRPLKIPTTPNMKGLRPTFGISPPETPSWWSGGPSSAVESSGTYPMPPQNVNFIDLTLDDPPAQNASKKRKRSQSPPLFESRDSLVFTASGDLVSPIRGSRVSLRNKRIIVDLTC